MKRFFSILVCSALIWTTPGIGVHRALAQNFAASRASRSGTPVRLVTPVGHFNSRTMVGSFRLKNGVTVTLPGVNAPAIQRAVPGALVSAALPSPLSSVMTETGLPGTTAPAESIAEKTPSRTRILGTSQESDIRAQIEKARDIPNESPSFALGAGRRIIDLITRRRSSSRDTLPSVSLSDEGSSESSGGRQRLDPPGDFPELEAAPVPEPEPSTEPQHHPLAPRIIAAVVGILPAALIGIPLLLAGSYIAGGLLIATGLTVSAMPFLTASSPRLLRALPGFGLLALGATAFIGGVMGLPGAAIAVGPVVALGGFGLWRLGRDSAKWDAMTQGHIAATFLGSLAGTTAVGLALLSPAGWAVAGASVAAFVSAGLYIHLPGWIGRGMKTSLNGYITSLMGVFSVMSAVRTDTLRFRRILDLTSNSWKRSPWNSLWLGVRWLPTIILEAVQAIVSIAAGLVIGTIQAPIHFFWGAAAPEGSTTRSTKFFSGWARLMYSAQQDSKRSIFDPLAGLFRPFADSDDRLVSFLGGAGMRAAQIVWLAYALAVSPLVLLGGIASGITEATHDYEMNRHAPASLTLPRLGKTPPPGSAGHIAPLNPFIPKAVAAFIATLPLYFFGYSLYLSTPFLGWAFWPATIFYIGAALAIAVLPLTRPEGLPKSYMTIPGLLLAGAGIFTAIHGHGMILGILAAVGGFALADLLDDLVRPGTDKKSNADKPAYIMAYVGALAMISGLGAALLGLSTPLATTLIVLAYVASPLLIYHLPAYIWRGLWYAVDNGFRSVKKVYSRLGFWDEKVEFERNIVAWYGHYLNKTGWNAVWMFVSVWPIHLALKLIQWTIAGVSGGLLGLMRFIPHFFWGLFHEIDPSLKTTRFLGGFSRAWYDKMEGNDWMRFGSGWTKVMNEKDPVTHRPTFHAFAARFGARALQGTWLVLMALFATLLSPIALIRATHGGIKAARKPYAAPAEGKKDLVAPAGFALRNDDEPLE